MAVGSSRMRVRASSVPASAPAVKPSAATSTRQPPLCGATTRSGHEPDSGPTSQGPRNGYLSVIALDVRAEVVAERWVPLDAHQLDARTAVQPRAAGAGRLPRLWFTSAPTVWWTPPRRSTCCEGRPTAPRAVTPSATRQRSTSSATRLDTGALFSPVSAAMVTWERAGGSQVRHHEREVVRSDLDETGGRAGSGTQRPDLGRHHKAPLSVGPTNYGSAGGPSRSHDGWVVPPGPVPQDRSVQAHAGPLRPAFGRGCIWEPEE